MKNKFPSYVMHGNRHINEPFTVTLLQNSIGPGQPAQSVKAELGQNSLRWVFCISAYKRTAFSTLSQTSPGLYVSAEQVL